MRIRRLPEIDLARLAPLPADEKRQRLRHHKTGWAPFSYEPARRVTPDVLNWQSSLLGPTPPTDFAVIEGMVRKLSRSEVEQAANLAVVRPLDGFMRTAELSALQVPLGRMPIGMGETVAYWVNAVIVKDGKLLLPFFDHRRAKGLTTLAKRFVWSMAHEHARVQNPDLADAHIAIFQFPDADRDGTRGLRIDVLKDEPLFSFDELDHMISETYAIWREVLEERSEEARRTGTGGSGIWAA